MTAFAEFESTILTALPQERSELQGLQGENEAQLSAWVQHLFQRYLGYTHFREISREAGMTVGARGGRQLYPDLRINVLDNGVIFVECKKLGLLDGPKSKEELDDAVNQLRTYIRTFVDQASIKPKTVLGVVTDGNRWLLLGLNKQKDFHTIAEWAFLTDDPQLIAQRLWLLAKPALAQPTPALVELLARRTLAEVLNGKTRWLTNKVNERLPDGSVTEELIRKWLRDAFSDASGSARLVTTGPSPQPGAESPPLPPSGTTPVPTKEEPADDASDERHRLRLKFWSGLLPRAVTKTPLHANIAPGEYNGIGASSGIPGLSFNYTVRKGGSAVELWIARKDAAVNKSIFDKLQTHRAEIEQAFGGELTWERLEDAKGCRICYRFKLGGWKSDEAKWSAIQDAMIDAMIRLEKALAPHLAKLRTEL